MTVAELLAIDPEDKKKKWRKNLTAVINNVNYKNDNKLVELTLADDTGEIKIALWKFKYQTTEKNEYWRMYEEGEKIKITNAGIKAGYNGGDNELSLMKDGTVTVLGTSAIPESRPAPSPEEDPNAFDNLLEKASGNGAQQKTLKVKNPETVTPTASGGLGWTPLIKKLDDLINAVNNIPMSVAVLQKEMNIKFDQTTTRLMQQFKEIMDKFIKK